MKAEIVSIGDEMTTGQRLDTNSQWLSTQLADLGVTTVRHTTIADDLELNVDLFRRAAERADFVISTGGLGPTLDDLTREAAGASIQLAA
ncbi:MAG: molybdopterin-binding protein [Pirellulales bacterium]